MTPDSLKIAKKGVSNVNLCSKIDLKLYFDVVDFVEFFKVLMFFIVVKKQLTPNLKRPLLFLPVLGGH